MPALIEELQKSAGLQGGRGEPQRPETADSTAGHGGGGGPLRDDAGRLQDILDSIQRIQERIGGGRQRFDSDEMLQVWAVYHLQIIGEAARSISPALRDAASRDTSNQCGCHAEPPGA